VRSILYSSPLPTLLDPRTALSLDIAPIIV
jgi:hypothetical protein